MSVSACGSSVEPVGGSDQFPRSAGDARLVGVYRNTSSSFDDSLAVPSGTQHVRVRIDCIGHGTLRVGVFGGTAAVPCGEQSTSAGFIGLSKTKPIPRAGTTRVQVRAPRHSKWSVALDFGAGAIDPATLN